MEPGSSLQPTQWVGRGGSPGPFHPFIDLGVGRVKPKHASQLLFNVPFSFLLFSSSSSSPCHSRSLFPKHTAAGSGSRGLGFGFWVRIPNPQSPIPSSYLVSSSSKSATTTMYLIASAGKAGLGRPGERRIYTHIYT
jgi:hypothetical protein